MAIIQLPRGLTAMVDDIDMEEVKTVELHSGQIWSGRISEMKWQTRLDGHTTYAGTKTADGVYLALHRAVMSARRGQIIDHKDGDGLNNVRQNLRFATVSQNSQNMSKCVTKASSRYKGVSARQGGKFIAYIKINRKLIHLGTFKSEVDAAMAYDVKAIEYFGEFAKPNFPIVVQA